MTYFAIYIVGVVVSYLLVYTASRNMEAAFQRQRGMSASDAHNAAQFTTIIFALLWPVCLGVNTWLRARAGWNRLQTRRFRKRIHTDIRRYLTNKAGPPPLRGPGAARMSPEQRNRITNHLCRVYSLIATWIYRRLNEMPDDAAGLPAADNRVWRSAVQFAIDTADTVQFFRLPEGSPKPVEIYDISWTAHQQPFCSMPESNREDAIRDMVVWINDQLDNEQKKP